LAIGNGVAVLLLLLLSQLPAFLALLFCGIVIPGSAIACNLLLLRRRDDSSSVWDSSLRDLVDYLARGLVDQPEQVEVEEIEEPDALVFELKVAEADLGKVIGKQGRTAKALRTILSAASAKSGRRVILEILE